MSDQPHKDEAPETAWRGNRRSSFAQEFHASEREKQSGRPSLLLLKGTPSNKTDQDKTLSFSTESPRPQPGKDTGVLTLNALRELKKAFEALETRRTHGRLDKEGFVKECMNIGEMATYMSQVEVEQLFMKVDVNNNGSVDWNDFTSFILLQQIIKLNGIQTYVTSSQDGFLKLWHTDTLKLLRTQENGGGAWISDIAAMAQQPLAAFAMDRSITFYDTGRLSFDVLGHIKNLDNIPLSGTWLRTVDNDKLLYGDDNGYLHVFNFTDEWGGENPKVAPGVADRLLPGMSEDEPWRIHSSWVTRLMYLAHSCSLMSGSMDGYLMMLDIEKHKKKWSAKEHRHGICSFSYGRTLNFIASCGLERHVNIWNPFTAKVMSTLVGHQAPVVDVVVNDKDNQVISVASDNLIKVWDMRNNRCLQTIYERPNQKSLDPPIICRIFYDQNRNALLAGGTSLDAWKPKRSGESKVKKICAVLYNPVFQQAVVGEETDSTVTIWDIETGRKTFFFCDTIKKTKMSAMSFDFSGRRLLIGGQDGRLSMWNFNNGQCLKEFNGFGQNEVSCAACLEEGKVKFVAAGGWNGKVCIWGDGPKEHEPVEHSARGHSDDVICMVFFPPNCFATGGYDGKCFMSSIYLSI